VLIATICPAKFNRSRRRRRHDENHFDPGASMPTLNRRELIGTLVAGAAWGVAGCRDTGTRDANAAPPQAKPMRLPNGSVDWRAVRELFPLSTDLIHLSTFLFVSQPKPVAEMVELYRRKIDEDTLWIDRAAFAESEGRPFSALKRSIAGYVGGTADELCMTSNATQALAMAYHGLRIRSDQEILTTEHDHYSQHESIRFASERSGCGVRYVSLYDDGATANAAEMVSRLERAIRPKTRAIGVTWVHSCTGVKLPIPPVAEAVARANRGRTPADRCLLLVDGTHGFGNQDVDAARMGADFFATSTHKWLFGPRGTGFLWGRSDVWPEMRPTIPTFDPEAPETWDAWMNRKSLPPTKAKFVSPGGFLAFENLLGVKAAVELHQSIGRDHIAARIRELNSAFREGAAKIPGVTLHTPNDPEVSGGITCYEVRGLKPSEVEERLNEKRIRTTTSPYKVSYARVGAGIVNFPEEIDAVLREIQTLTRRSVT
jgi:selenocysteine lyase/cysteine desulfurase